MQEAGSKPNSIWKIVRWTKQRSQNQVTQVSIPTLKQDSYEVKDVESKTKLLRDTSFPPPLEVDLSDLENFQYPSKISQQEEITEEEILRTTNRTIKDNVPGPDKLSN